jgi:hypothetical protein
MERPAEVEDAIQFWQRYASRRLTQEDARQAIENTTGFFATLERWSSAPKSAEGDCDREAA